MQTAYARVTSSQIIPAQGGSTPTQQRIGDAAPPAPPEKVQVMAQGTEVLQIVYITDLINAPQVGENVAVTVGADPESFLSHPIAEKTPEV